MKAQNPSPLPSLAALLLLATFSLLTGCFSTPKPENPGAGANLTSTNALANPETGSTLRVGDFISISFTDVPNTAASVFRDQKIRIPDDGLITLPYNVRVKAANRTVTEVETDIRNRYVPEYFVNLTAIVRPEERFYYVGGEVRSPGNKPYFGNVTVLRAIEVGGGFTDFARRSKIELRRENGKTEYVNWNKARRNPKLDLPVFPNDHVIVPKGL